MMIDDTTKNTNSNDNNRLENLFSPIRSKDNDINNSNNKLKNPNFLKYENIVSTPSLRQRMKMKGISSILIVILNIIVILILY